MVLKIKRADKVIILFYIMFSLLFFHRYLVEIGFPSFIRYVFDLLNIVIFGVALNRKLNLNSLKSHMIFSYILFLAFGSVALLNGVNIWGFNFAYFLFDCRNTIRFLMFFLSCTVLLDDNKVEKLFNFVLTFHIVNCIFILYQYFTLEVPKYWMRGDNLNGFFGTATGGNIYVNALLVSTTIIILHQFKYKLCSKKKTLFFIGLNLIIPVLIELKAFFAEVALIVFIFAIPYLRKLTVKRFCTILAILMLGTVLISYLIHVLYIIYPWMKDTMSLNKLFASTEASSNNDIGRLTFFNDVVSLIYKKDYTSSFVGVGLGTANINNNTTKFAQTYFNTHYSWYSMPYVFIETGFCGMVAYVWSFLLLALYTKKNDRYHSIALCTIIISIFILFYDEAFKTEAGYLLFFMLSIPYRDHKEYVCFHLNSQK